jgi:hypothetical protein
MRQIPKLNIKNKYFMDHNEKKIGVHINNMDRYLEIKIYMGPDIYTACYERENFEKYKFEIISETKNNKKKQLMNFDYFYNLLNDAVQFFQPIEQKHSKYFCEYDDITNYIYISEKNNKKILYLGYVDNNNEYLKKSTESVDIEIELKKLNENFII